MNFLGMVKRSLEMAVWAAHSTVIKCFLNSVHNGCNYVEEDRPRYTYIHGVGEVKRNDAVTAPPLLVAHTFTFNALLMDDGSIEFVRETW